MARDKFDPKNLMNRKRDRKTGDQIRRGWTPTNHNDSGKGDVPRSTNCSKEEYALRWDLAMGKISKEDFNRGLNELDKS